MNVNELWKVIKLIHLLSSCMFLIIYFPMWVWNICLYLLYLVMVYGIQKHGIHLKHQVHLPRWLIRRSLMVKKRNSKYIPGGCSGKCFLFLQCLNAIRYSTLWNLRRGIIKLNYSLPILMLIVSQCWGLDTYHPSPKVLYVLNVVIQPFLPSVLVHRHDLLSFTWIYTIYLELGHFPKEEEASLLLQQHTV